MPDFLMVLCRSPQHVPASEVQQFIRDGWFFEQPARIEVYSEGGPASSAGWTHIEIHYQEGKRPVVLSRVSQREQLEAQRDEALEELRQPSLQDSCLKLVQHLQACQQVFVLEVDPASATEESWGMIDALEAWLARTRDGVLFVSGEGFYDAALQPLCKLNF